MANNEFTMNYKQANETQLNIGKIISDLQQQNNELSSEISRLSSCRGTKENPHNHDAEIAALSAQIQANNNWINQLSTLKQGIADLTALAQATDKKLVTYLTDLFCKRREEQLNSGIYSEQKAIDHIKKQIADNPNMPDPQKDAMLAQIRQHQVNITTKQKQLNDIKEKEAKNEIEKARLNGACPEQLDAMTAAENAKNVNEKNSFISKNNEVWTQHNLDEPGLIRIDCARDNTNNVVRNIWIVEGRFKDECLDIYNKNEDLKNDILIIDYTNFEEINYQVYDSYKYSDPTLIKDTVKAIQKYNDSLNRTQWKRTDDGLYWEWLEHNLLYIIPNDDIKSRAQDADLDEYANGTPFGPHSLNTYEKE